jgi:hypothetical protein
MLRGREPKWNSRYLSLLAFEDPTYYDVRHTKTEYKPRKVHRKGIGPYPMLCSEAERETPDR